MYDFSAIPLDQIDEEEFNAASDKSVFTTVPWLRYVLEDNPGGTPIVLRITKGQDYVGYFTGVLVTKLGIRIVGSPFRGWSTCFMGFDLVSAEDRIALLSELESFLFSQYKCRYFEFIDRNIPFELVQPSPSARRVETLELRVDRTDEELFKVFKTDCRNFIRQFERRGARIEIARPDDQFADEFYEQLIDVFAKQDMRPTYSPQKVKRLLRHLGPDDMVLCLRVRDPEGRSIATSIFPGFREKFFFWGDASYQASQSYRPNEYMIWTAIRYWRGRGLKVFDMMGVRDYKRKFGSQVMGYAAIEVARPSCLIAAKNMAEKLYFRTLRKKRAV